MGLDSSGTKLPQEAGEGRVAAGGGANHPGWLAAQVYAVAQRHEGGLGDGIDLGRIGGEDGLDLRTCSD